MAVTPHSSRSSAYASFGRLLMCLVFLPAVTSFRASKHMRRSLVTRNGVYSNLPVSHVSMRAAASSDSVDSMTPSKEIESSNNDGFFNKIRKVSNIASMLCVLDCTLLPIITVIMPLLGLVSFDAKRLEMFHQLGHALALWFVLPVGGTTTIMNFLNHKKKWITSLAVGGMTLIGLANTHFHVHSHALHTLLHAIQHGKLWHPLVNVSGCALLLTSNFLSQKQGCAAHGSSCDHDHHHHHDHGKKEDLI